MKDKAIGTVAIVVVVALVAAGAVGGYMVMSGGTDDTTGGNGDTTNGTDDTTNGTDDTTNGTDDTTDGTDDTVSANATVMLHDATTIDLSKRAENYLPDSVSTFDINVEGTVTVNTFSATNVTLKLHNQGSDNWITIVNEEDITDLTTVNEFTKEIYSGTYDKMSLYIDKITVDIEWTQIKVTSETMDIDETVPSGEIDEEFTIGNEFTMNFSTGVVVSSGDNRVFDADTGAPFSLPFSSDTSGFSSASPDAGLDEDRMHVKTVDESTSGTDGGTDEDTQTSTGTDYSGTWESSNGTYSGEWEFTVDGGLFGI